MFSKKYRLNLAVRLEHPKISKNSFFTLLSSINNKSYNRYGFIAAKKDDKRSVARNKVKRMFSYCLQNQEGIQQGYDMIFVIKKEAFGKEKELVCQKITEVLKKEHYI